MWLLVSDAVFDMFDVLVLALEPGRRRHSFAVARKVVNAASHLPAGLRSELVTAALLHDIGYTHVDTGLHALDGARFLADAALPRRVCHLVVHHSASTFEGEERGLDLGVYADFAVADDLGAARAALWWADMTTGPHGEDVTVEERLDEICARYGRRTW
jgi:putative nucleotidyltransferase with HDIG domain